VIATELMPKPETSYRSYLLRLRRPDEAGFTWRAMLESVTEPGEQHYFKDLESLATYLLTQQQRKPPEAERDE
jgi:hypothetical protein